VFARATVPVMAVSSHAHMDGNIRSILVPRDSSLGSAQALSAAKAFAQATGAQIELLHVVEPLVRYFRGRYIEPGFEEQMRDKSGQEMKRLAARLRERGFKADGRAVIGQPAATIVTVADEINADLIVMTTTGLTGLTSKILGSVTHEVLRTAHSPLLLLHFNSTEGLTAIREDAEADARRASESNDGVGVSSSAATSPATLAHVPPH
jgi:nucleotide-binding universal stress UspA family protein